MSKLFGFLLITFLSLAFFHSSFAFPANFTTGSDTLENPKPSEQSIHTVVFTLTKSVPADGDILITIPAVDATGQGNNGFADTASATVSNGFDLNNITASNILVSSSGCNNNWGVGAITEGTATTDHKIRIYRVTDSCAAGSTITVVIGDSSKKMINPAPLQTPSPDGRADIYTLHVRSRDGSGNKLDQLDVRAALVGPVVVSATVAETFSFTLAGISSDENKNCGVLSDISTTPSSIPWGNITKPFTFKNAAQLMTVSTNAEDGYVVTVSEDDQLKRKGFACPGANPGPTSSCIADTRCDDGLCTERSSSTWSDPKNAGFGFSLENTVGKDSSFLYNDGSIFFARQFADLEAGEQAIPVLSGNGPTTAASAAICYRISISDRQPAGYYTNHLLYTASPKF